MLGGYMTKLKWFHVLIIAFLLNFIFLITFGISFNYDMLEINIFDFAMTSLLVSLLLTVGFEYKINHYLYFFATTNLIAVLYMAIKYIIYDYSWSALVPTIGYYYILAYGFLASILFHIVMVLLKRKK
jgi:hypothetical protein